MSSQMHWWPLGPDPRTVPQAGTWVRVEGWCGCGRHLGVQQVQVPNEVQVLVNHGACLGPPTMVLQWQAPAAPWTPQHP